MWLKIYNKIILCLFLSIFQISYPETINVSRQKLDNLRQEFKNISQSIIKIGQSKIPNPFSRDIESINQLLNSPIINEANIENILSKLRKIKTSLLEMDQNTKVSIPKIPGKLVEQPLKNFLATTYSKFASNLKHILDTKKITYILNPKDLSLLKDSFKPIFFGFYDLFEHPYYKYLETIREDLHFDLSKEKLELIKDLMEMLLADLNDENQNQTMMVEVNAYQRYNLSIHDFKELIKKFINNVANLIK